MHISPLQLSEVMLIDAAPAFDERGFFARTFDKVRMEDAGIYASYEHEGLARNTIAGTLRGMHFQRDPFGEHKLVQCVRGRIFDVVVDVRCQSPTYGQWVSVELSGEHPALLYVPPGFAHGYQTLQDETDVMYHLSPPYEPAAASGVSPLDPALAIPWPLPVTLMSQRDRDLPELS